MRPTTSRQITNRTIALLNMELHVVRIMINEAGLHPVFWACASESNQASDSTPPSVTRSKMLWSSLNSCKDFIHTFMSYRNQELFYLTVFVYPRLCYVFITIARLVFLDFDSRGVGASPNQSDTRDFQSRLWGTANVAKEADYQRLGKRVFEKFTAVATNFIGPDGQRDAMSNLASSMRILITGYEHRMNEIQNAQYRPEMSGSEVEMIHEHPDIAVDSTTYSSVQEFNNGGDSGTFDIGFTWDSSASTIWDDILENFTIVPFT
jgi:hypothetical protein